MAGFAIGTVTVTFGAMVLNHNDNAGYIRDITCGVRFHSEADWNTFRTFANSDLQLVPIPWANSVEVIVRFGPGSGTLTISGLTPSVYTAWMADANRTWANSVTGQSIGRAKFYIAGE